MFSRAARAGRKGGETTWAHDPRAAAEESAAGEARSRTNLRNVGLNLNRSWDKAHSHAYNTPFLSESSTKDLSLPTLEIVSQRTHPHHFRGGWTSQPYDVGPGGLSLFASHREGSASPLSSMDSDLEAFSHNPADGSFGALAVQPTP